MAQDPAIYEETLKACLLSKLTSDDFCDTVNILMQSSQDPSKRVADDRVQAKIGIYILAKALSDDSDAFSALIASKCGGRGNINALDQLLGFGAGGRTGKLDTTQLPIIAEAMEIAEDVMSYGPNKKTRRGGKKSKGTKKRRSIKKQKGGTIRSATVKMLSYAITAGLIGGAALGSQQLVAGMGVDATLTGMSKSLSELLVQSDIIKNACSGTGEVTGRYILSFAGLAQTCSDIAMTNELQLANLTSTVTSAVGFATGITSGVVFSNLSSAIERGINEAIDKGTCATANMMRNYRIQQINEVETTEALHTVTSFSDLTPEILNGDAKQATHSIMKALITYGEEYAVEARRKIDINQAVILMQNIEGIENDAQRMNAYMTIQKLAKYALDSLIKGAPHEFTRDNIVSALMDYPRFKNFINNCISDQSKCARKIVIPRSQTLAEPRQTLAEPRQTLAEPRQTLAEPRQAAEEEVLARSETVINTGVQEEKEGGRRRRRHTIKAKKHHKNGKKAHQSRKGKKVNHKTKKHHKKGKKSYRKSRKH
jgi:hypothetical protein